MPAVECCCPCSVSVSIPRFYRRRIICVVSTVITIVLLYKSLNAYCQCVQEPLSGKSGTNYPVLSDYSPEPLRLPSTYLAVVILSAPSDQRRRDTIRHTWLKLSSKGYDTVRHWFPIGLKGLSSEEITSLRREQADKGDLMFLESHQERYDSLSGKMRRVFVELSKTLKFEYVLKTDADSFVRLGVLLKALKDQGHPMLYWGFLDGRATVKRRGKYREKDWVLCDRYLPYAVGGGYVLSWPLADFIARNYRLLKLYANEDVSVGAWLAGLNVRYVHDPRFDTEYKSRGCSNEYLITHKQDDISMASKFESLRHGGNLCEKEYKSRGSYVYDWAALPSQCCQRTNDTKIP